METYSHACLLCHYKSHYYQYFVYLSHAYTLTCIDYSVSHALRDLLERLPLLFCTPVRFNNALSCPISTQPMNNISRLHPFRVLKSRVMHPWFDIRSGLMDGDVGAWLYRVAHSLHHKSHNPGPWSGLSMHPIEHFLYYSCTLTPLVWTLHPVHFLFNKFHADVSPLPGHDGYDAPTGGGSYFHYLHHGRVSSRLNSSSHLLLL